MFLNLTDSVPHSNVLGLLCLLRPQWWRHSSQADCTLSHNRPSYTASFPRAELFHLLLKKEWEKEEWIRQQRKIEQVQEDLWVTGIVDGHEAFIISRGARMRIDTGWRPSTTQGWLTIWEVRQLGWWVVKYSLFLLLLFDIWSNCSLVVKYIPRWRIPLLNHLSSQQLQPWRRTWGRGWCRWTCPRPPRQGLRAAAAEGTTVTWAPTLGSARYPRRPRGRCPPGRPGMRLKRER